jgi:hypothetical protein
MIRTTWLAAFFWIVLGAAGLYVLSRSATDYVASIASLQDLRWRVAQFVPPTDAGDGNAVIEIQNRSNLDLTISELELFLWSGNVTVAKTYGTGGLHTVRGSGRLDLPLTLVLIPAAMADARARASGQPQPWGLTGSYKVSTPLSDFNLRYQLRLETP